MGVDGAVIAFEVVALYELQQVGPGKDPLRPDRSPTGRLLHSGRPRPVRYGKGEKTAGEKIPGNKDRE